MTVTVDDTDVSRCDVESVVDQDDPPEDPSDLDRAESPAPRDRDVTRALGLGLALVVVLGGLAGWLGYQIYQARTVDQARDRFLEAGRQAALNLTTIDFTTVDADIQRVLDSSIGDFHTDFQDRSSAFAEVVRQAQSRSEGTISEAGIESVTGRSAQILVATAVRTANAGVPEGQARYWRMRITVEKVGDDVKVSNVEFVP
ncbi:mammalian cell entry protein [Mycolicibacterium sp.]|uniref:mammalian cell entry protein n=1 Tax=Mycolicibacterium sp. TaxID=2320850 RepID=UPI0037CC93B1